MSNAIQTLTKTLAAKLNMGDGDDLIKTLKATAFKGEVTDAQMTALMVVANQYGLNPWTKEIYAFPDKQNGIVPVVGVDGWSRIINSHPEFDGMEFQQDAESCTCIIYRKDRSHPIKTTEWHEECYRPPYKTREGREIAGPWQSHPKRMLRHKAMIQCARLAFGFVGIFDQDEAERTIEVQTQSSAKVIDPTTGDIKEFSVTEALDEVHAAQTIEKLQEVWAKRGSEATAAKDRGGYRALIDAVNQRKAELQQAAEVTDV